MKSPSKYAPRNDSRATLIVRADARVRTAATKRAKEAGFESRNDYIVALLATDVGLPELAPAPLVHEELDLDEGDYPMTG